MSYLYPELVHLISYQCDPSLNLPSLAGLFDRKQKRYYFPSKLRYSLSLNCKCVAGG